MYFVVQSQTLGGEAHASRHDHRRPTNNRPPDS